MIFDILTRKYSSYKCDFYFLLNFVHWKVVNNSCRRKIVNMDHGDIKIPMDNSLFSKMLRMHLTLLWSHMVRSTFISKLDKSLTLTLTDMAMDAGKTFRMILRMP